MIIRNVKKSLITFCFIFLLLVINTNQNLIYAQDNFREQQEKLKQLHKSYNETYKDSFQIGLKYAEEALSISKKINDLTGETEALIYIGKEKNISGKYIEANSYFHNALNLTGRLMDSYLKARCYSNIGYNFYSMSIPDSAIYYSQKSYDLASLFNYKELLKNVSLNLMCSYHLGRNKAKALEYGRIAIELNKNNKEYLAESYAQMGIIYGDAGNSEKSLDYILSAVKILEEEKNWPRIAFLYSNLASAFGNLNDIYKSIDYNKKALEIFRKIKDYRGMGYVLNNIGISELAGKNYSAALGNFRRSLAAKKQVDDKQGMVFTLNNIAEVFLKCNLPDSAYNNINQSLQYAKEINDRLSFANTYQLLGEYHRKKKNYPVAIEELNTSLKYARSIRLQEMIETIYAQLSEIYNEAGDKPNAFYYLKLKNEIHDSVNTAKSQKYVADMMIKYDTEKKDEQLKQLNEKSSGLESEIFQNRILMWGIIAASIFIIAFLLYYFRQKILRLMMIVKIIPARSGDDKRRLKGVMKIYDQQPDHSNAKQIDSTVTEDLIKRLDELMKEEKIYLNPQIAQSEVAKKLNTNTAYLSKIINDQLSSNFSNYINQFRIEEAKNMIRDNVQNNFTFEGIAQSVGFNSKSAFNLAFKKFTGKTPSQFASQCNSAKSSSN